MKIAHITMFYEPAICGVKQVVRELAERQVKHGHEVHVFCCNSDKEKRLPTGSKNINGVKVHYLPYWFR
ncbi:MAG: glycosyltransferase, partial [Candidatus Nanoarchaeia archaeon]